MKPKMKRQMHGKKEKVDKISTLPDSIIIYILSFLITKEAVQTCILSKRWKNIWKYVPTLIISSEHFQRANFFKKFLCKVLQHRDASSALSNIEVEHKGYIGSQIFSKIINSALSHEVEQFKLDTYLRTYESNRLHFQSMFFLHSLKYLDLTLCGNGWIIELPDTINLPELITCHLRHIAITSSDKNSCAKPFLKCKKLSTLVLENCRLSGEAETLCLCSDKLVDITVKFSIPYSLWFKLRISAPNLKAFTFAGVLTTCDNRQIFEHKLDFIEEANIDVFCFQRYDVEPAESTFKNWLKGIRNVHSLTLSLITLEGLSAILKVSNMEPTGFYNLKTLTVKRDSERPVPDSALHYLLQDSPLAKTIII